MRIIARRFTALVATTAALAALAVPAQTQENTGRAAAGGLSGVWQFVDGRVGIPSGGSSTWAIDPADQHPFWVAPRKNSRWIAARPGWEFAAPENVWTTYFMRFTVARPDVFTLSGKWASDNLAEMWLNGQRKDALGFESFVSLTSFSLDSGFVAGSNVLAIQVFNGPGPLNPSGVLVTDLRTSSVAPEPISLLLVGTGLAGLGVVRRRPGRRKPGD